MQIDLYYILTHRVYPPNSTNSGCFWYVGQDINDDVWEDFTSINDATKFNVFEAKCVINKDKSLNDTFNWRYLLVPATSTPIQFIE